YRGPPLSQRIAMARDLREDSTGLSPVWQILAVVVVTGALIGAFYYFYVQHPPPAGGPRRVEPWDTAEIGYVGTFADDGRVFDTAYARVARDNVSYPKAASFSWRAQWTNFSFDVGCADLTPAEQQIKSCTAAIKGFDQGVRGMAVGDTKRIVVPPELGYGASDPSKIFERPLLQEVPARVVMNGTAFQDKYGTRALDGLVVRDPFWGWNATVSLSGNVVTVTNSPFLGEKVRPYGAWDALVAGIDDAANNGTGIVYVQHDLAPDDARDILAHDGSDQFIVTSVDLDKGVYVADYNREVVGRTLVFDITIASIIRK
ncbi:MAG TPA: FKBP-type peptidyl-prolyl cis-trans isomerase, partial [Thermoplasmata archaeon]|nr:FKBP-type peptidyl-prolyl cis-trans isomerase [Thermoplasmata archaeon]